MSWTCAFSRGRSDQVASAGGRLWLCIGSASVALGSRSAQEVKRMPARYVSKQQHAPPQPQTTCTAALARSPLERRKGLFRRRDGDEAADRRPHAPSGTDAASDSRNADHLATPSLISASTGGPTRGPIPVRSAVRFWQKFLPAAKGGAPRRGIVKRRTRASPQRVRALPRRSRRPSVRLRSIWHHSTRTPLPCVP